MGHECWDTSWDTSVGVLGAGIQNIPDISNKKKAVNLEGAAVGREGGYTAVSSRTKKAFSAGWTSSKGT